MLVLVVLVTPHCTLSCHQTSELPYEITGRLCTEKSRSESRREGKRRSMIFLPRSGLRTGWSVGDRWTYQKVTRVWVSPRITSWYFSSTTRPRRHHLSPRSQTPRLAPSQLQTGQLDYWNIIPYFGSVTSEMNSIAVLSLAGKKLHDQNKLLTFNKLLI